MGFVVPQAQKVLLLETRGERAEIGVPEKGLKGWSRRNAVAPVLPH
ncbi:MAG TPA: hypothetical protein P5079_00675 [Elusimicrobiota bacterium]|nr:hypothetical protein [Elusimicrobiota bacterium]